MAIRAFGEKRPVIGTDVFVDDSAIVIGDVRLHDGASVWPGAIIRADDSNVEIGRGSAMMDMSFAEAPRGRPVTVGDGCIISHGARLHGCTIGPECVVGIGAIVLDGSVVGERSVIAAGSLVTPGAKIPPESFVMGTPGRVARSTTSADMAWLKDELKVLAIKSAKYRERR
jgi:carbonic anhydrase/acetyltransferase-like protein (isoleucine patch superfamily)